jgi:hypothetical protein
MCSLRCVGLPDAGLNFSCPGYGVPGSTQGVHVQHRLRLGGAQRFQVQYYKLIIQYGLYFSSLGSALEHESGPQRLYLESTKKGRIRPNPDPAKDSIVFTLNPAYVFTNMWSIY